MKVAASLFALLALAACNRPAQTTTTTVETTTTAPAAAPAAPVTPVSYPPVEPLPPGRPGALPDDRTPISEAPFTATSVQGAADVVQVYFALIGEKDYARAWKQWRDGTLSGFKTEAEFAASFGQYLEYRGLVGAPGESDGAAGSIYIDVPVQVYGRRADGRELHQLGKATLKRVNDVDGATAEQLLWRIVKLDLAPAPIDGRR